MYRIIGDRGSGKTKKLMLAAKETGSTIVCKNPYAMAEKAHAYGITGLNIIGYQSFLIEPIENEKIMIDEVEDFLNILNAGKITGYTLTNED